jgi:hypothetical protein
MEPENTGNTAVAEQPAQTGNRRGPKENSPSALQFAVAWNDPSVKTRADVIKLLESQGFAMSYSALVNRHKSYTDPNRKGGAIKLKTLEAGQRGRRVDGAEINRQLAELAASQTATEKNEGESA